jgi:hypothetical protein
LTGDVCRTTWPTSGGGASFGKVWEIVSGYLTPTTTIGIITNASSTIGSGVRAGGLTINGVATTTNGYLKVVLPSTTSPSPVLLADMSSTGYGDMGMYYSIVDNAPLDARLDRIIGWGYNVDHAVPSEPHAIFNIESYYNPSGAPVMEAYLDYRQPGGASTRPWQANYVIATGSTTNAFSGNTHIFYGDGGTAKFSIDTDADTITLGSGVTLFGDLATMLNLQVNGGTNGQAAYRWLQGTQQWANEVFNSSHTLRWVSSDANTQMDLTQAGTLSVRGTTASSALGTGSLINYGGLSSAGAAYIGGALDVGSTFISRGNQAVLGDGTNSFRVYINGLTNSRAQIEFQQNSVTEWNMGVLDSSHNFNISQSAGGAGGHMLTIMPTGNVGLGTSTPSQRLDVKGKINIEGSTNGIIMHDTATANCYIIQITNGTIVANAHACK